jgi:hypothetical protein
MDDCVLLLLFGVYVLFFLVQCNVLTAHFLVEYLTVVVQAQLTRGPKAILLGLMRRGQKKKLAKVS